MHRKSCLSHINCRQKGTFTDGNIHTLKIKPEIRDNMRKMRLLKTNVTEGKRLLTFSTNSAKLTVPTNCHKISVTQWSSSQTQQAVKLINSGNLPQFMNEPTSNVKPSSSERQIFHLHEEPLLFIPEKVKTKLESNQRLIEKFMNGFEQFLRLNPQQEAIVGETVEKTDVEKVESQPLAETDTELQKEYDPLTQTSDLNIQKSLNQSLKCYINACVSENMTERAFAALMWVRQTNSQKKIKFKLNDPELYSSLLAKYAMIRNWKRLNEIYTILIDEKIPITPQVYMNILDCLGRNENSKESINLIKDFITKAAEQVLIQGALHFIVFD